MRVAHRLARSVGTGLITLLFATARSPAQVVPNRTTVYLHPTDVTDARALWVNPAGLGRVAEASIHGDVTVGDPGAAGRLRQLTLGFGSRGFSFGYQRDVFDGGGRGHTYRLGIATSHAGLAAGAAATLYRGGTSGRTWDLGVLYEPGARFVLGGVIASIGQPVVRGVPQRVTFIPGATLRLAGGTGGRGGHAGLALSAHGRITPDSVAGYAFGVLASLRQGSRWPARLLLRLDTDGSLRRAGFALGLSLGGNDLVGAVVTFPGDVSRPNAASLYGVSTRQLKGR